jgi:ribonucleoside-diphosphate reductase alpha chain
MYRNLTLEEDLALKKVITDRTDILHNQFAWRDVLGKEFHVVHPEITVTSGSTESQFSLAQVADTIGSALTDLLISRQTKQDGIFNDANRAFVSAVAHNVAKSLTKNIEDGGRLRLTENDLYLLIEPLLRTQRRRRCQHCSANHARPPHPPQWQRRPLVRNQNRNRCPQGIPLDP